MTAANASASGDARHHQDLPGVKALDGFRLISTPERFTRSSVKNGAGKSTLMKVIRPAFPHRSMAERSARWPATAIHRYRDAEAAGIAITFKN